MPTYNYPSPSISTYQTLLAAMASQGVTDATVNLNGDLEVVTDTDKTTIDVAVGLAAVNSLYSNKQARKADVWLNTGVLLAQGVTVALSNGSFTFSLIELREDYAFYWTLHSNAVSDASAFPIRIWSVTGELVSIQTVNDALLLAIAAQGRFWYLLDEMQNDDNSYGDAGLKDQIDLASTQAALDLIIDTRT